MLVVGRERPPRVPNGRASDSADRQAKQRASKKPNLPPAARAGRGAARRACVDVPRVAQVVGF